MKRQTLAITLAAAFAAPAFAQSNAQLYGKLYPFVVSEKGSGATAVGTTVATFSGKPTGVDSGTVNGMAAGNSHLGIRGTESLGGDLKVLFQLEGTVGVDSGAGGSWNRNTFVGLAGGFGTIKLGNHDTVFKEYGDTLGVLGVSSGTFMSTSDVLRKTGFGTSSASSFHLRRKNSIVYETQPINNFQFGAQYSTDEVNDPQRNPRLISLGARYDAGPLYVSIAHEIHWDFFGGSRNAPSAMRNNGPTDPINSKDRATQLAIEYRLGKKHKFEFDVIRKLYEEDATVTGRFSEYSNTAYLLAMETRWTDQFRTTAHIVRAGAGSCSRVASACTTDGLDATKYLVAAGYSLSKRTMLFGALSVIRNGKSARFNNSEFDLALSPGEDIRQLAFGVVHRF